MMKRLTWLLLLLLSIASASQAKSWKVGPSSVEGMDFASINKAVSSASVTAGDTLYLDQYYNENDQQTVTKRVVIIGTGYDTSLTDEGVVATLTSGLVLKADGIVVKGLKVNCVSNQASDCTLERCCVYRGITYNAIYSTSSAGMLHVYSCYVTGRISGYSTDSKNEFDIQNCTLCSFGSVNYGSSHCGFMQFMNSSTISNNTIYMLSYNSYSISYPLCCLYEITNSTITNNIILSIWGTGYYDNDMADGIYASGSGNSIEHNILSRNALGNFPQNKTGYGSKYKNLFSDQGNYSDNYRLSENSDAKGYATDGGEVGCHGGMFGCPADGRPQYIPYFSKVVVASRTEDGKLPVSVTVKIQDK